MAKVTFAPSNITLEVPVGTNILEAARQARALVESPCNGSGTCGKCKVNLEGSGSVLACQTVISGDIRVEIPHKKHHNLKILSQGKSFAIEFDSFVQKIYSAKEDITRIEAGGEVLGTEEGNTAQENFGVVVDIGTTTLVTSLLKINTGEEVASAASLNPQSLHAQDVLSRIKFASEEKGLLVMYSEVIKEVNRMIDQVTKESGVSKNHIYEIIFSGNTCMLHLATGVNPYSLGKYPYRPKITGGNHIKASEHGLDISEYGIVYLPPIVSAYVGADITSGVLAARLHQQKGVTLFVDIGTNGEMVLGFDGRLSATSTAAGPAFEGMNITCGMRAAKGAVELFDIGGDGNIQVKTIGESKAVGICGSGLLDIVGELVAHGAINGNGKFVDPEKAEILPTLKERLAKKEGKSVFVVSENVYLTQKDVRQVQLAKGAIRAGIEFLMKDKGITAKEVDKVLIAGSFGYHLRAKSLINIGLLPKEFTGKIEFIGNTSQSGGKGFLLNKSYRAEIEKVVKGIEVLELANYKDFDKVFVNCLGFKAVS